MFSGRISAETSCLGIVLVSIVGLLVLGFSLQTLALTQLSYFCTTIMLEIVAWQLSGVTFNSY